MRVRAGAVSQTGSPFMHTEYVSGYASAGIAAPAFDMSASRAFWLMEFWLRLSVASMMARIWASRLAPGVAFARSRR